MIIASLALTACGNQNGSTQTAETPTASPVQEQTIPAQSVYSRYCFKRVGQVGGEPRRGDVCEVGASGAGGFERGTGSPPRNTATLSVSAPSLEAVGVSSVAFVLNRKSANPIFPTGVHTMDQISLINMELGANMPDRMVFVSDKTGENSMFSYSAPDAAILRERMGAEGVDIQAYEIASAILKIDKAADVPLDDFAADYARRAGMVIGKQYIEGTLTVSLIPIGSEGVQFGPTTFEFGTTLEWGYAK